MSLHTLAEEDVTRIRSYLSLPPSEILPSSTFAFLKTHLHILPTSLLLPFSSIISPRQRSTIPIIKSRRLLHASRNPPPTHLRADSGRLRWPLLWERLGGSSLPPPSLEVEEEEDWVTEGFMPGKEGRQHVKKLGGFLRGLEEERELEGVREARKVERRLDDVGEEFDDESDEEDLSVVARPAGSSSRVSEQDQDDVKKEFERKLLELFVDGLDTIDYDEIDFSEPVGGDAIVTRDQEERYFDDEEPCPSSDEQIVRRVKDDEGAEVRQNGRGDYDY